MPRAPPVTIAVLPSSMPIVFPPAHGLRGRIVSSQILSATLKRKTREDNDARRRLPEVPAHRSGRVPDRHRGRQAHAARARPAGAGEGGVGQSGRHQGAQARRAEGRRAGEDPRVRRDRRGRRRRAGRDAVQGGRRGLVRGLDHPPGHQLGIPSGRRAHRRAQAEVGRLRGGRRPAAHLDHRVGNAVRPLRHPAQRRRRQIAADHRRRGRRRLDRDPACAHADQAHRDRDRVTSRDATAGARSSARIT